jgi:hypothetical protein
LTRRLSVAIFILVSREKRNVTNQEYKIPTFKIDALEAKLVKLNKKAVKLGCPAMELEVLGTELAEVKDEKGRIIGYNELTIVTIIGETPRLPGWSFEGIVDFSDPGTDSFLLRMAPGADDLPADFREEIRATPGRCDHCQKNRHRKETFIVRHDSGGYKLVGRTCLKDFTEHQNPAALMQYFKAVQSIEEELFETEGIGFGRGCGSADMLVKIEDFMLYVCVVARIDGFVTRKQANESYSPKLSTADYAWNLSCPIGRSDREAREALLPSITNNDRAKAKTIIAFIPTLWEGKTDRQLSDFLHNVKTATSTGMVSAKTAGVIAAAYLMYEKDVTQKISTGTSEYQGTVKDRIRISATCYNAFLSEGMYGITQICKLKDSKGNVFSWFNTGRKRLETGTKYNLTGTVKKHQEYRGTRETVLTRCRIN